MRTARSRVAAIIAILLLGVAAGPAASDESAAMRDEILAWNDTLEDAFVRGDAAAIAEMFTADAVIIEPLRPACRGRDAIREYFRYYIDFGLEEIRSRTDEIYGDGETIVEIGRNHVYLRGERASTSRYMCLYKKVDGRWLAHRVVGSS